MGHELIQPQGEITVIGKTESKKCTLSLRSIEVNADGNAVEGEDNGKTKSKQ